MSRVHMAFVLTFVIMLILGAIAGAMAACFARGMRRRDLLGKPNHQVGRVYFSEWSKKP